MLSNVSQPWKLLRSASADDTLVDLTTSSRDEADWDDRSETKSVDLRSTLNGFGMTAMDNAILELVFLGSTENNDTGTWTLYSWRDNGPCELVMDGTIALGQLQAETDPVDAQAALTSYFYADTIAVSNNYAGVPYQIVDSGNDRIAKLKLPAGGHRYWALYFTDLAGVGEIVVAKAIMTLSAGSLAALSAPPDIDIGNLHLLNTSGTKINPATEEKQGDQAIAASGQHLDNAGSGTAAATNYSVTVVALKTYSVHAVNGVMYLGIADATSDANVLWTVGAGQTRIITIPSGTSLTYAVDTAGVEGRLARIV